MTKFFQITALTVVLGLGLMNQGCYKQPSKSADTEVTTAYSTPAETTAAPVEATSDSAETSALNNVQSGAKIPVSSNGAFKAFPIYTEGSAPDNHFVPSGWMGDYSDLKINEKFTTSPHGGASSIQIIYSNKASQGARWVGMYWQNPPNNWGTRPGGYNLTGAKKLTFWARGDKGGEHIEEFKLGGITGEYADSDVAGIGPVVLTTEWQQFTIDLEGKDLSSISGGFCWSTNLDANPEGATFYLDDIKYE